MMMMMMINRMLSESSLFRNRQTWKIRPNIKQFAPPWPWGKGRVVSTATKETRCFWRHKHNQNETGLLPRICWIWIETLLFALWKLKTQKGPKHVNCNHMNEVLAVKWWNIWFDPTEAETTAPNSTEWWNFNANERTLTDLNVGPHHVETGENYAAKRFNAICEK